MAERIPICVKSTSEGTSIVAMTLSKRGTETIVGAAQTVLAEKGHPSIHIPPANAEVENEPGLQRIDVIGDVTADELKNYLAAIQEQAAEDIHASNLKRREQEGEFGTELMEPIWAEEDAQIILDDEQKRQFMEIEDEGRKQMREAGLAPGKAQEAELGRG